MFRKPKIDVAKYVIAPEGWTPDKPNPFGGRGGYEGYSALYFLAEEDGKFSYARTEAGVFTFTLHKYVLDKDQRVFDFIDYESKFGRIVILGSDYGLDIKKYLKKLRCETRKDKIRKTDPAILVHSTTTKAWQSIEKDMTLKSPRRLMDENISFQSVGFHAEDEPEEYKDFVKFGGLGAMPEFMFQAQQYGRIVAEENDYYDPGVRLYLDCHKMIRDQLIWRDGIHEIKVKSILELRDYLIFNYSVENKESNKKWTPKSFADECDKWFHRFTQGIYEK
ncbi:MAG: hypothetical protein PQJ59_10225 [Spirochaetales bacterium]|nr:hypothetical protein [Spirochaetales bacterium]